MDRMDVIMNREKIIEEIRAATEAGRLSCERAHELSRRLNVPLREIGALCDELKIRISACGLGCF
jgi:hypothetical protein